MSRIALVSPASGTATYSITTPSGTSTDRTLNLPDSTGTVLNDQSDIEAQVKTATNASGDAPIYSCRSWVNFNGTGTVAIRASGNVSSITDNGTGDYTVNFTTAMPDADYAVAVSGSRGALSNTDSTSQPYSYSTSSVSVGYNANSDVPTDATSMNVCVFR